MANSPDSRSIRVAAFVERTSAEGPHERAALWVQGCSLRCPGCCNPEMFDDGGGQTWTVGEVVAKLAAARDRVGIEGVTVLGGEPLEQTAAVTAILAGARRLGLGTLVFSGYRWDEARRRDGFADLWREIDTLVDGRFAPRRPEPAGGRRFLGSTNQRILHRTLRYADPALWRGAPRAEVRISAEGRLTVVGFPPDVAGLLHALPAP